LARAQDLLALTEEEKTRNGKKEAESNRDWGVKNSGCPMPSCTERGYGAN